MKQTDIPSDNKTGLNSTANNKNAVNGIRESGQENKLASEGLNNLAALLKQNESGQVNVNEIELREKGKDHNKNGFQKSDNNKNKESPGVE